MVTKTNAQPKLSTASQKIVDEAKASFGTTGNVDPAEALKPVEKRLLKLEQDLKAAKAGK